MINALFISVRKNWWQFGMDDGGVLLSLLLAASRRRNAAAAAWGLCDYFFLKSKIVCYVPAAGKAKSILVFIQSFYQ